MKKIAITLSIDKEILNQLYREAKKTGLKYTDIIRIAISEKLTTLNNPNK